MQDDGTVPGSDGVAGGDPVCWLHLVCESCGALIEREGDPHRAGCEAARAPAQRPAQEP